MCRKLLHTNARLRLSFRIISRFMFVMMYWVHAVVPTNTKHAQQKRWTL